MMQIFMSCLKSMLVKAGLKIEKSSKSRCIGPEARLKMGHLNAGLL